MNQQCSGNYDATQAHLCLCFYLARDSTKKNHVNNILKPVKFSIIMSNLHSHVCNAAKAKFKKGQNKSNLFKGNLSKLDLLTLVREL